MTQTGCNNARASSRLRVHRHTDTQTHRHTDTQTHRHTDTQTHRHTDTDRHKQTDTETQRHRDTETNRQTDKQTQTQTQTDTDTDRHRQTDTDRQPDRQTKKQIPETERPTDKERQRKTPTERQRQKETHLRRAARRILMSTCHRLHLRTRPTPSPGAVMQTGCKNARASSRLRVPQLHAAAGRLSPGTLAQWSEPVGNGLRLSRRCPAAVAGLGTLPARFGLVVWIGVLEVRGWFPIQLQHDPGVQTPKPQTSN